MCVVVFILNPNDKYKLILISSREESYDRPTKISHYWNDKQIIASKDLKDGGAQIAIGLDGKLSVLTNLHTKSNDLASKSRGLLVTEYHEKSYIDSINDLEYRPYNLITGKIDEEIFTLSYVQFQGGKFCLSPKETYMLENKGLFDKSDHTEQVKGSFQQIISQSNAKEELINNLFELLNTMFKKSDDYGTRSQTVIIVDRNNKATFIERSLMVESLTTKTEREMLTRKTLMKNCNGEWVENKYQWYI